ncbi:MAG: hypothetical protein EBW01_04965 [Proteobacteria bacterium]|nr:hypothetical protein [Pseudomonadota bacterium]
MNNLFDIACNFSSERFDKDLDQVIQRAKNNNVNKFLVVSASLNDIEKINGIYEDNKDSCFFTIGVHPHNAKEFTSSSSVKMKSLIDKYKPNSVGETGLDYYYSQDSVDEQKASFVHHINVANDLDKPLIVHTRDARKDTISVPKIPPTPCTANTSKLSSIWSFPRIKSTAK